MYRYYKITPEWAEKLGETLTAPKHPDGMYLVTPSLGPRIAEILSREDNVNLLPGEAFEYIGAIGLSVSEAHASKRGELRHDREPEQLPEAAEEAEVDDKDKDNDAETQD